MTVVWVDEQTTVTECFEGRAARVDVEDNVTDDSVSWMTGYFQEGQSSVAHVIG